MMCDIRTHSPQPKLGAATVPDETSNAAVAVGADMARAVIAAEHYRTHGHLPAWATDRKDH
mgnify:CR=1 FL=1